MPLSVASESEGEGDEGESVAGSQRGSQHGSQRVSQPTPTSSKPEAYSASSSSSSKRARKTAKQLDEVLMEFMARPTPQDAVNTKVWGIYELFVRIYVSFLPSLLKVLVHSMYNP